MNPRVFPPAFRSAHFFVFARSLVLLVFSAGICAAPGVELHVATSGNDANRGTRTSPLRSIQRAAELAQPGDVITVHAGLYRERINPPRGGLSDSKRIIYRTAPGERVEIKGSEVVKNWTQVQHGVWKVTLPNGFFGDFNPFADVIHGDWFDPRGRTHHTGAVYLNGDWLVEAATLDDVLKLATNSPGLWFARVDESITTIWAQFNRLNPNEELVEINKRRTVFYPDKPGRNYITVRGFELSQAATPWAPPTAEQIGLIGTHWSKGWIIEDNIISHSICSGVSLGKYGDEFDNTSANTAEGYVKTIERALNSGWSKEHVGHHLVRNNTIFSCEQAGIVGSLGAAFSTISGNEIHDIHVRRLFSGAEMAGIKFHAAIDTVIRGNHIHRTCLGLWLDWMAQGTRVSANLFHDNAGQDLFVEVDHGPFMVDNNLFLSTTSLLDMSEGGAYVHNLFAGKIVNSPEPNRETPFHPGHSTAVAGLARIKGGDDRFYNNVFFGNGGEGSPAVRNRSSQWIGGYGLWVYDEREFPVFTRGNVFCNGAMPYGCETNALVVRSVNRVPKIEEQAQGVILHLGLSPEVKQTQTPLITTALLGRARVPGVGYEQPDGSLLEIRTDYFGKKRSKEHPFPGPFEKPDFRGGSYRVWPLERAE
jgi:hypothetical protein